MTPSSQQGVLALFDGGVHDLIPLAGKRPTAPGWPELVASRSDVESWLIAGNNIGLRTKHWPAIDCDVVDEGLAGELLRLLPQWVGAAGPVRTGRAPKFAIACRTDSPFRKRRFELEREDGTSVGAVEILGEGQQFVVAGTHPDTGQEYAWALADRVGGVELLAEAHARGLPLLTADIVDRSLAPHLEAWASARGLRFRSSVAAPAADRSAVDQAALRAPSIDALREAVTAMPNEDADRAEYVRTAAAIRAAAGPEHEVEGRELFELWAAKWPGNDHDYNEATWESVGPPHAVGWSLVADRATAGGFNAAIYEFTAVADAPSDIAPLGSEAERIAALHEDATRAFLLELPTLGEDASLLQRWRELHAAAVHGDPLAPVFYGAVLPKATRIARPVKDEHKFATLLKAEMTGVAAWAAREASERHVLTRAAFALLADESALTHKLGASPGKPLPLVELSSADGVIAGWLPRQGLGAIVGPPASGKTFVCVELAGRIAKSPEPDPITQKPEPERFAGRAVRHGTVLYFAGEDAAGVAHRAALWARANGADLRRLHVFGRPVPLSYLNDAISFVLEATDEIATSGDAPALIVIDTFRTAFSGEENSSGDVSAATTAAAVLARMFDVAVVLVHHSPKTNPNDPRGSSALKGALDFMAVMHERAAGTDPIGITAEKVKNGPSGDGFTWHLADGVLREGRGEPAPVIETAGRETFARAAVESLRSIAPGKRAASRTELNAAMADVFPQYFAKERLNPQTARSNISRGINAAVERGWLDEVGAGRTRDYRLGSAAPGEFAIDPDAA